QIIEDRVVCAYRHSIGSQARVCVSDGTKAGVEIDSGCVCVRHHVNCQDEFLARREPQLVLQALGKSDNPRRAAVTREAHSVDGLDGRCGNWSSQPGRRAAPRIASMAAKSDATSSSSTASTLVEPRLATVI